MKSWMPRDGLHATLLQRAAALAGAPQALALAAGPHGLAVGADLPTTGATGATGGTDPLPEPIADWLTQLTLLYGVPFQYLVPDTRLLPPESLRFFYVDRNWQDRTIDGALSVGAHSSGHTLQVQQVAPAIYAQIDAAQARFRAKLRNAAPAAGVTTGGTWSGCLFRSVVVSTWPGLEINATAAGVAVPIVRMDLITSDILICLFNGVPDTVQFIEPGEGLHFGVDGIKDQPTYTVSLRGLGYPTDDPYVAGEQIEWPPGSTGQYLTATGSFRGGTGQPAGVLDVGGLVTSIQQAMPTGALGPDNALTPGGFAIQMVRGAGLQAFETSQPPPAPVPATPTY